MARRVRRPIPAAAPPKVCPLPTRIVLSYLTDLAHHGDHLGGWKMITQRGAGRRQPAGRVPRFMQTPAVVTHLKVRCARPDSSVRADASCLSRYTAHRSPGAPLRNVSTTIVPERSQARRTADTRVIISAYRTEKLERITRVSCVIRPKGLGDLRSPV